MTMSLIERPKKAKAVYRCVVKDVVCSWQCSLGSNSKMACGGARVANATVQRR